MARLRLKPDPAQTAESGSEPKAASDSCWQSITYRQRNALISLCLWVRLPLVSLCLSPHDVCQRSLLSQTYGWIFTLNVRSESLTVIKWSGRIFTHNWLGCRADRESAGYYAQVHMRTWCMWSSYKIRVNFHPQRTGRKFYSDVWQRAIAINTIIIKQPGMV